MITSLIEVDMEKFNGVGNEVKPIGGRGRRGVGLFLMAFNAIIIAMSASVFVQNISI
jgi:hypothetical protein